MALRRGGVGPERLLELQDRVLQLAVEREGIAQIDARLRQIGLQPQRFPEVPRLTPQLEAACDLLDELAESPAIHLDMEFRPGDIQFVNNHWIMHSRTAFEDFPEPENRRHLFRLWLACEDGPALPEVYTRHWQGATRQGRPAGIRVPGVRLNAPLDASW